MTAVEQFLRDDVVGQTQGHLAYSARVAANVLAIVRRELECAERHCSGEWARLAALFEHGGEPPADSERMREQIRVWTSELTDRIRAGDADDGAWRRSVVAHLKQTVQDKLEVAKGTRVGQSAG